MHCFPTSLTLKCIKWEWGDFCESNPTFPPKKNKIKNSAYLEGKKHFVVLKNNSEKNTVFRKIVVDFYLMIFENAVPLKGCQDQILDVSIGPFVTMQHLDLKVPLYSVRCTPGSAYRTLLNLETHAKYLLIKPTSLHNF